MSLDGVDWRLVVYLDSAGATATVPDGIRATARFADGRVSGSGGCNRYSGSYEAEGERLSLGSMASTMMACDEDRMAVESGLLGALSRVAEWSVSGGELELRSADGQTLLRFVGEPEPILVGVEWHARAVNNGRGGVQSLVAGTTVTATFDPDGRISGSGGCNRYFGPYELDGPAIRIGPLGSTRMLCPDDGVSEQESAYFAALGRATQFGFVDRNLELRDDDGALQVAYRASAGEEGAAPA